MKKTMNILVLSFLLTSILFINQAAAFETGQADFSLIYQDLEIPFQTFSIFVLPEKQIKLTIASQDRDHVYSFQYQAGKFIAEINHSYQWQAPAKPGNYKLVIKLRGSEQRTAMIKLNVFVLYPRSKKNGNYLNGFRIGNYPDLTSVRQKYYSLPPGFWEIKANMLDLNLTPHFKVKQFLTKQSSSFPQYIFLQEKLLLKLEYFLAEVNKAGYAASTFNTVSVYRTPYFNTKLGNDTLFSRHLFGDAADIYLDSDQNKYMDDLNKDGKINQADADILLNLAVEFDKNPAYSNLQGGIGSYPGNNVRGPFIHLDTRGFHVAW